MLLFRFIFPIHVLHNRTPFRCKTSIWQVLYGISFVFVFEISGDVMIKDEDIPTVLSKNGKKLKPNVRYIVVNGDKILLENKEVVW
jgi:hypothetical protein